MTFDIPTVHAAIHRYCRSRLQFDHSGRSAEDIAQETLIQLVQKAAEGQEIHDPVALGLWIANRRIIDEYRRRSRVKEEPFGIDIEPESVVSTELGPREIAALAAIDHVLTETQRRILWMRTVENLPHSDIGAQFAMTAGSVRVTHFRALARIRAEVAVKNPR